MLATRISSRQGKDDSNFLSTSATVLSSPSPVTHQASSICYENPTSATTYKPITNFVLINCQSICNKTTEVMQYLIENRIEIAAFTETWLSPGNEDLRLIGELELPGYKFHHKPRAAKGGGIGALVSTAYKVKLQKSPDYPAFENIRVSIQAKSICIHLIVIYRIPSSCCQRRGISAGDFIEKFSDYLDSLSTLKGKLIIAGDFNIHWDTPNENYNERKDPNMLLNAHDLHQHVYGPHSLQKPHSRSHYYSQ